MLGWNYMPRTRAHPQACTCTLTHTYTFNHTQRHMNMQIWNMTDTPHPTPLPPTLAIQKWVITLTNQLETFYNDVTTNTVPSKSKEWNKLLLHFILAWAGGFEPIMTSSNGNTFRVTGPLCGHRWISCTKASDVELWCCLWSAPE